MAHSTLPPPASVMARATLTLSNGTINNLAGGLINAGSVTNVSISAGTGTNRITNAGVFNANVGTVQIGVPFTNSGTVVVGGSGTASLEFTDVVSQLIP